MGIEKQKLKKIEVDLFKFQIRLFFQSTNQPLVLLFDKPARRFYFALIALVIKEMQKRNKTDYIWIRSYQNVLRDLDKKISGEHASKNTEAMWGKIRKAWRERLLDLRKGVLFKVENRDRIFPGAEVGGHLEYDCTEQETDIWATLISYDSQSNRNWHYKFDVDAVDIPLKKVLLTYQNDAGGNAWKSFVKPPFFGPGLMRV